MSTASVKEASTGPLNLPGVLDYIPAAASAMDRPLPSRNPRMSPSLFFGSIIGLRPECTDRYRVLHEHIFPGVLDRIRASHIRNYSIFLCDGVLFSYMEYVGQDHAADMAAIGTDPTTRKWWTLTDSMQCPLPERAEGEWWAMLPVWHAAGSEAPPAAGIRRVAFAAPRGPDLSAPRDTLFVAEHGGTTAGVEKLRIFQAREQLYFYLETTQAFDGDDFARTATESLRTEQLARPMEEVFHTDGLEAADDRKRVFVTGCFDMLHSGHVAFLEEAAQYGDLYVGIGSDATIYDLKGRYTVNSQDERKYVIEALGCVKECRINTGRGFIDFEQEVREIKPDVLVVNEDGHSPIKESLCRLLGIRYQVLKRIPHAGLPPRSTTLLRTESRIPFRIDLAGGWLDQPYVSKYHPGPVLTISIEPTIEFNDRSGMASSTRRKAIELWRNLVPHGEPEQLARVLFSYENPPGTKDVAGSQDALGIVLPALNRLYYEGGYWPTAIESVHDEETLSWIEQHLHLVTLGPRISTFTVLDDTRIDAEGARALADAAEACWRAILARDLCGFGDAFRRSFEAQVAMFPRMVDEDIHHVIDQYRNAAVGWKLSGAGGGGYLILVSDVPVPNTVGIKIRRRGVD
jgi:cytidyltransferase-like protein